jgi:hypothetical protein
MILGSFHWQLYWAHLNSFVLLLLMGPHIIYSYFYSMGPRGLSHADRPYCTLALVNSTAPHATWAPSHPQHFDVISHLYLHICCADTKSMSSLSGPSSNPIFKAIMSASHDTLIRSGNVAYMSLRTQFVKAQCELEAERSTILTG